MKYTSAEANKLLRKLNERKASVLRLEECSKTFQAAVGEDVETVRPDYCYRAVQTELDQIDRQILKIKHAVNLFNVQTKIPGFDLTIDQALVYMAQLSNSVNKLSEMKDRLPKQRLGASGFGRSSVPVIEYDYANYDISQAAADFTEKSDILAKLQTALDLLNNTESFEIDVE